MTTIVDVARLAGVSISTVSHVVNGTRPVAPGTRSRVLEAIESTGYRQHTVARALRRARTDTLGLIISEAGYPVLDQMVIGVEHEARKRNMTVFLAHSGDDLEREIAAIRALRDRRVDGILLAPVADSSIPTVLDEADGPVILLDRPFDADVDQVGVANLEPTGELVRHLIGLGHRRIGFVARGKPVSTLRERYAAYKMAMDGAGLSTESLSAEAVDAGPMRRAVRRLLRSGRAPSALVCASQMSAVHALEVANELGLQIPDDISVVTFDEFPFADLFQPRLTSVVQPALRIGREAVKLLERRLDNPDVPVRRISLRPKIEYRASTAPWTGAASA